MVDYGARYYSPWTCRFVSVDPQALKYVNQSPYVYADNNPISKMDYNGEGTGEGGGQPANDSGGQPAQNQTAGTKVETHQVKKGETLNGIAKQHGTTVDSLRKANNLEAKNDTKLQIGTKLNIPQVQGQNSTNSNSKFNFTTVLQPQDNTSVGKKPELGLAQPKTESKYFMGDKFENAQFQKDVSSGRVDAKTTYDSYSKFTDIGLSFATGLAPISLAAKGGKELFKFGGSVGRHMAEPGRAVPVQILEQAIKGSKGMADPGGSKALMHSIEMWRNGKPYQLDVLYNKSTNTIWHFQYSPIKP